MKTCDIEKLYKDLGISSPDLEADIIQIYMQKR